MHIHEGSLELMCHKRSPERSGLQLSISVCTISACIHLDLTQFLACSAILAHYWLNEKLNVFGILGCVLCIVGSMTIVLHAPEEREILPCWRFGSSPYSQV